METTKNLKSIIEEASAELAFLFSKDHLTEEDLNKCVTIIQKYWEKAQQFMSYDAFINQVTANLNDYKIPETNKRYLHLWD